MAYIVYFQSVMCSAARRPSGRRSVFALFNIISAESGGCLAVRSPHFRGLQSVTI